VNRFGTRLAVTYVTLILLAGSVIGIFLYVGIRDVYVGLLADGLVRSARTAAAEAGAAWSSADLTALATEVAELTGARVTLIARDGTVLTDTQGDPATMGNHADRPEVRVALAGGTGVDTRLSLTTGQDTLYVAVPVGNGLVTRLAVRLAATRGAVGRLRLIAVVPVLALCVLGAVLAYRSALRITRPLYEMSEVAREMARGNLAVRSALDGPAEAVELGQALNVLAAGLESHVAQLHLAREGLETLLAALPVGIVEVGRDYSVVSANPAAERLLGFRAETARGRHYAALLAAYSLSQAVVAALEEGRSGSLEVDISAGREALLHVSVSPRRAADGKVAAAILVLEDLGQTRRDARARRELVANVSHELKTPVAAIRALAETLSSGALSDPEAAGRFLSHIGRESERLAHLVDDLLELARLEAREARIEKTPVDLASVVERTVERFRPIAAGKGLNLVLELRHRGPLSVVGDESYLERVVANLLDNAVKFTPEGGRVLVSVARRGAVSLSRQAAVPAVPADPKEEARPSEVLVEVTDSGAGIDSAAAGRVFERFYRVAADRSRQSGGTGLGLAIVKHVVQLHGGRTGVSSGGPGQGSRFWFTIPTATTPQS